jgi:hypothetical protein
MKLKIRNSKIEEDRIENKRKKKLTLLGAWPVRGPLPPSHGAPPLPHFCFFLYFRL